MLRDSGVARELVERVAGLSQLLIGTRPRLLLLWLPPKLSSWPLDRLPKRVSTVRLPALLRLLFPPVRLLEQMLLNLLPVPLQVLQSEAPTTSAPLTTSR